MGKTVLGVTLSKIIGLLGFLILLALANILRIDNSSYLNTISFLNQNLWIVIIFSIFFYLGELFALFKFPINLPKPIFNALGGIFLVGFIFNIFYFIDVILNLNVFMGFINLESLVIIIVPSIILLVGYIEIFKELIPKNKKVKRKSKKQELEIANELKNVWKEFKKGLHNLAVAAEKGLRPKKKRK